MQCNSVPTFDFTLAAEGGADVSMDPEDGGNWSGGQVGFGRLIGSKYGVSAPEAIAYLAARLGCAPDAITAAIAAKLTEDDALAIWAPHYWQAMRCADLPAGVDLMTGDHGYNRGITAAGRVLQLAAGMGGKNVDGWIGNDTIHAAFLASAQTWPLSVSADAMRCLQKRLGVTVDGIAGPITAAAAANARCHGTPLAFIAELADAQAADYRTLERFPLYGDGWIARVWSRCDAAMALVSIV